MFSIINLFLPLTCLTTALAIPTRHRLEDIQCRCLSFSSAAKPILCNYLEPHVLDWQTAYNLASESDLKIHFSSELTVTQILLIPRPLPSSVLQILGEEDAEPLIDPSEMLQNENKIICGLSDTAKHVEHHQQSVEQETHDVGAVLGGFMLLLMIYVAIEYIWTIYVTRSGNIKLDGEEKDLTADSVAISTTEKDYVACTAPAEYS